MSKRTDKPNTRVVVLLYNEDLERMATLFPYAPRSQLIRELISRWLNIIENGRRQRGNVDLSGIPLDLELKDLNPS